jgi:hypothetical protein
MSGSAVAVLSYHGWEIPPQLLARDVADLRAAGWKDIALDELAAVVGSGWTAIVGSGFSRISPGRRYFHITLDDGAAEDGACVEALEEAGCPATLFISLDAMSPADRAAYESLRTRANVSIQDHSLRHARRFQYRHIVGFHSDERPLMTSPERLALATGDPVCTYGGELARPAFEVDPRARQVCRDAAANLDAPRASVEWQQALADRLLASGLAFHRLGRLCVRGRYESDTEFRDRIALYLEEGRDRLARFTGRSPLAFAHPWWEPGAEADSVLAALGYRLTFSGRGLATGTSPFAIPRLFVSSDTPRPLDPAALSRAPRPRFASVRDAARRLMFA